MPLELMVSFKCRKCSKAVTDNCRGIQCDICLHWFHLKCSVLSVIEYSYYTESNDWYCPFNSIDESALSELAFNSNEACLCSNDILNYRLRLDSLPCFEMSSLSKHSSLSKAHVDLQLPCSTSFEYYTPHDFHLTNEIHSFVSDRTFSV